MRADRSATAVCAAAMFASLVLAPGAAAAGDVDAGFASNGVFTASPQAGTYETRPFVSIDSEGRALIAFAGDDDADGHGDTLVVGRLTAAGALDPAFKPLGSNSGLVQVDLGPLVAAEEDVSVKGLRPGPSGSVVVLATTTNTTTDKQRVVLVRLAATGDLDPGFGDGGRMVDSSEPGDIPDADALAVDVEGRMLVAGRNRAYESAFVLRYTSSGALDSGWGTNGKADMPSLGDGQPTRLHDIEALAGGGAVVAGEHGTDAMAVRLTAGGALDSTFSGDGMALTDLAHHAGGPSPSDPPAFGRAWAVAVDGQDRVVIGGDSTVASYQYVGAAARFTAAGNLDTSFGSGQPAPGITFLPGGIAVANDLRIGCGDRVLLAGSSQLGPAIDLAIARLTASGVLDATFAPGRPDPGALVTDLGASELGTSLATDAQGRAYVAGNRSSYPPLDSGTVVMRHLDATGCAPGEQPPGVGPPSIEPPVPARPPATSAVPKIIAKATSGKGATSRGAWFSAYGSEIPQGIDVASYGWDLNSDRFADAYCPGNAAALTTSFSRIGTRKVGLQVTDTLGRTSTTSVTVQVTRDMVNKAPTPVFNCSNPGANNQPDRADCVKTFAFGIVVVNSRGRPTDCFTLQRRNRKATSNVGRLSRVGRLEDNEFYRATVKGPVALNGIYMPIPSGGSSVYDSGEATVGIGTITPRFGPYAAQPLDLSKKIEVEKKTGRARLASISLKAPEALGFLPVAKAGATIDLIKGGASLSTILVGLPNIFTWRARGGPAEVSATIRSDNINGADLDGVKIGPIPELLLGPLTAQELAFAYSRTDATWTGSGKLGLTGPSPVILDASPPPAEEGFQIKRARFSYAGASAVFPIPASRPVLFPGISLKNVGVTVGVDPFRLTGSGGIAVGELIEIDGALFMAFPTESKPYDFPSDGVGDELAALGGRRLTSTTLALGGTASIRVPGLGKIFPQLERLQLYKTHLIYQWPGYLEYSGSVELKDKDGYFSLSGALTAFADAEAKTFNLEGKLSACLEEPVEICSPDVGAVISSKGLGLCTLVPLPTPLGPAYVPAGVGYRWGDDLPDVMVFSCSLDDYREVSARAAQAGAPRGFTLPAGLPSAQVRVRGAGAPPRVLLTGPKGERIEVPASGRLYDKGLAVFPEPRLQATTIALRTPAAGRWTVSALDGSPTITSVAVAQGHATPRVKARVTGNGGKRRLVYDVQGGEGWTITLAERGARTASTIGVAKGGRGEIPFTPAPGRGERRRIVARLESPSGPLTAVTVGAYRAARERPLARARRVRATRRGAAVNVTWRRVTGAQRYAVTWVPRRGAEKLRVVRTPRARFVTGGEAGRILLTALDGGGRAGGQLTVRVRARR